MRSRWFHPPHLHTKHDGHKRVGWLELFYDLVFVAAAIQLGDALSTQVTATHHVAGPLAVFGGYFALLFWSWTGVTFYANRFDVDDFLHRGLVFVNMLCLGTMAIVAPAAMEGQGSQGFALALAAATTTTVLMYVRSWRSEVQVRDYSGYTALWWGVSAGAFSLSAVVPEPFRYALWAVGVVVGLASAGTRRSIELYDRYPVDMHHLTERFGLLVIVVLGESFVKVLSYLSGSTYATDPFFVATSLLPLVITFSVWWTYFDDIEGAHIKRRLGSETSWMLAHLPLTLGITALGVGLKKIVGTDFSGIAAEEYRWLLGAPLAIVFVAIAVLSALTERPNLRLSGGLRVGVRLVSAVLVLLATAVGDTMSAGSFVAVITGICLGQVAFDIIMAPLEEEAADQLHHSGDEAMDRWVSTAEESEEAYEEMLAQTVRLNVPSGMNRDLFFTALDGSWTQLLVLAVLAFVGLNLGFAGLYMLHPASIGGVGADGFGDAFSFSVQTFTTIGYGAMSPGTAYGDFLVAAESIVGIVYAALVTGLVVAKASVPKAGVLFSNRAVVPTVRGQPTLMVRVGNVHGRDIVDVTVHLVAVMQARDEDGTSIVVNHPLRLANDHLAIFSATWIGRHVIDEHSPLAGPVETLPERVRLLMFTLSGHDASTGQKVTGRKALTGAAILPGYRFADTLGLTEDGRPVIDFAKMHAVQVQDG